MIGTFSVYALLINILVGAAVGVPIGIAVFLVYSRRWSIRVRRRIHVDFPESSRGRFRWQVKLGDKTVAQSVAAWSTKQSAQAEFERVRHFIKHYV